jgi:predicted esterase
VGDKRRASWSAGGIALLLGACAGALGPDRAGTPSPSSAAAEAPRRPPADAQAQPGAAGAAKDPDAGDPAVAQSSEAGTATPDPERFAIAPDGTVGAWLAASVLERARPEDESRMAPRLGDPALDEAGPRWRIVSSPDGSVDLGAAFSGPDRAGVAYAGARVRVEKAGARVLLVGVTGAADVTVFVDGRPAFASDRAKPHRDDEDLVPIDVAEGEHTVLVAISRRATRWTFHARWLDAHLGATSDTWRLPGLADEDARTLGGVLSTVAYDRGTDPEGTDVYAPHLTVRFRAGAPEGTALRLRARLVRTLPGASNTPSLATDANGTDVVTGPGEDARLDMRTELAPLRAGETPERTIALGTLVPASVEDSDFTLHLDVSGRRLDLLFHPRRAVREALRHAARAWGAVQPGSLADVSAQTIDFLRQRLLGFANKGDSDTEAEEDDARELDDLATAIDDGKDPYDPGAPSPRTGPMRRAYLSPADGHFSEFAVYLPPHFDRRRSYPLIAALHGMNGRPMEMLMWLFGHDDPARDGIWEDRHPRHDLEYLDAIVVAPDGHFNAMYRDAGEDDVMRVIDWAVRTYPVDRSRVTITGPSMGGIGSAACAFHRPDVFAAAEPLCGYHSYLARSDVGGHSLRPWERFIAQERSNVEWAENGQYLPLYIVHGTKDLPEENSGVLIDRYETLHYKVEHEHPDLGHNVWQPTYEDLKGAKWLLGHQRPMHPREVRFRTPSPRWGDNAWLHVNALLSSAGWGDVVARIDGRDAFTVRTRGVAELSLDRDALLVDDAGPVNLTIDGTKLVFQAGEPIDVHVAPRPEPGSGAPWIAGTPPPTRFAKRGTMTGPLRDVFHEPILFVWGDADPAEARVNEEVAREWARDHAGVHIDYPVLSDTEFAARGESLANDHALFLVGNARTNLLVRELERDADWPIRVDGDDILMGTTRFRPQPGTEGRSQLGAAFIRPNPRRPDRYVVVVEGTDALGTWRSESLPDMLPDYVVYDESVAPARGQLLLGGAGVRTAGFFDATWSLTARAEAVSDAGPPQEPPRESADR